MNFTSSLLRTARHGRKKVAELCQLSIVRRNQRRKELFLSKKQSNPSVSEKETENKAPENKAESKAPVAAKKKPESKSSWNSELVEGDSRSVIMKLKMAKNQIPQYDGQIDDETNDAEVQTEEKLEVKHAATQTIKSAPGLGPVLNWSTEPPRPPTTNMGPYPSKYRPPHSR